MPTPSIQYTRARDGASIAYWTMGEGRPFVLLLPPGYSNIQFECDVPEVWEMYSRLARSVRLVRFDFRNCGLSVHGVADNSLDALVSDVEAVARAIGAPAAYWAGTRASKVGLRFAALNPTFVRGLVVQPSTASFFEGPQGLGVDLLVGQMAAAQDPDWFMYSDMFATAVMGLGDPIFTRRFAELIRSSSTAPEFVHAWSVLREGSVEDIYPKVDCPVLVLHRRSRLTLSDQARAMTAAIPNARLAFIDGQGLHPWEEHVAEAIERFMLELESAPAFQDTSGAPSRSGTLRTILFTDIEAHTVLMRRLGDDRGREVLREHERITREALHAHGGTEVKTMGDGFMASFDSAQRALECAIELERAFEERNATAAEPLRIRVGVNAGEPIEDAHDLFGASVIESSRIAAQAKGGEILVSDVVRQLSAGKGFLFSDRGEVVLRGFDDPVRLYELRWQDAAAT